jgi:hypothetical protein
MSCFTISACNVYQSSGRKEFESKIPDSQTNTRLSQSSPLCWVQPQNEALWSVMNQDQLIVSIVDDQFIQVCKLDPHLKLSNETEAMEPEQ